MEIAQIAAAPARDRRQQSFRLSVAPMMDWTDRYCRLFHRAISRETLLYTEMVTAQAVIHGDRDRLLGHDAAEQPLALQLGGAEPRLLAEAARIGTDRGYGEINLNCGCPSDRVQSGAFGAVLMKSPGLVADCLAAMRAAAGTAEVTVKCRIGVDDQIPEEALPAFLEAVAATGVSRMVIHARKAWLEGLNPKQNREIPPLDHALVYRMKRDFPALRIVLNGGIDSIDAAAAALEAGLDGVMVGRAAYQTPMAVLGGADARIFGGTAAPADPRAVVQALRPAMAAHLAGGGRLHQFTRHMMGLFHGRPGARGWRRILTEGTAGGAGGLELLDRALAEVG